MHTRAHRGACTLAHPPAVVQLSHSPAPTAGPRSRSGGGTQRCFHTCMRQGHTCTPLTSGHPVRQHRWADLRKHGVSPPAGDSALLPTPCHALLQPPRSVLAQHRARQGMQHCIYTCTLPQQRCSIAFTPEASHSAATALHWGPLPGTLPEAMHPALLPAHPLLRACTPPSTQSQATLHEWPGSTAASQASSAKLQIVTSPSDLATSASTFCASVELPLPLFEPRPPQKALPPERALPMECHPKHALPG